MSDKLPKVSIAVVGVVIAQIGGFIWWTAQQASTIQNLEEMNVPLLRTMLRTGQI